MKKGWWYSALEAVRQFPASTLLAIVLAENDTGIAQSGPVRRKIHLAPPNNLIRVNGGQALDEGLIVQLCFVGFEKKRHAGEHRAFKRSGCATPCCSHKSHHPGESRATKEPISVDNGAGSHDLKRFAGGAAQCPDKARFFHTPLHIGDLRVRAGLHQGLC